MAEYKATFRAIAHFSELSKEADKAKRSLQALKREANDTSAKYSDSADRMTTSNEKLAASIQQVSDAQRETAQSSRTAAAESTREARATKRTGAAHEDAADAAERRAEAVAEVAKAQASSVKADRAAAKAAEAEAEASKEQAEVTRDEAAAKRELIEITADMSKTDRDLAEQRLRLQRAEAVLVEAQKRHTLVMQDANATEKDRVDSQLLLVKAMKSVEEETKRVQVALKEAGRDGNGFNRVIRQLGGEMGRARVEGRNFAAVLQLFKIPAIIAAVQAAISGIDALLAGTVALIGPLTRATAVLGALPGLLIGLAQGALVAVAGFKGLGEGIKALLEAEKATTADEFIKAQEKVAEAFQNMTPAARSFAETIVGLKPILLGIRQTAQSGLLPGAEDAVSRLATLFPILNEAARTTSLTLGQMFSDIGKTLTSNQFKADWPVMFEQGRQAIAGAGIAFNYFLNTMRNFLVASGPLQDWFISITIRFTAFLDRITRVGRETGRLETFFRSAIDTISQLGRIISNTFSALYQTMKVGGDLGDDLWSSLERLTAQWERWTKSVEGQNALKEWFDRARKPLKTFAQAIGVLRDAWSEIAEAGMEGLNRSLEAIRDKLIPSIVKLGKTVVADFLPRLIEFGAQILDLFSFIGGHGGQLSMFLAVVNSVLKTINHLINTIPGLKEVAAVLFVIAGAWQGLKFVGAFAMAFLIKPLRSLLNTTRLMTPLKFAVASLIDVFAKFFATLKAGNVGTAFTGLLTSMKTGFTGLLTAIGPVTAALAGLAAIAAGAFFEMKDDREELARLTEELKGATKATRDLEAARKGLIPREEFERQTGLQAPGEDPYVMDLTLEEETPPMWETFKDNAAEFLDAFGIIDHMTDEEIFEKATASARAFDDIMGPLTDKFKAGTLNADGFLTALENHQKIYGESAFTAKQMSKALESVAAAYVSGELSTADWQRAQALANAEGVNADRVLKQVEQSMRLLDARAARHEFASENKEMLAAVAEANGMTSAQWLKAWEEAYAKGDDAANRWLQQQINIYETAQAAFLPSFPDFFGEALTSVQSADAISRADAIAEARAQAAEANADAAEAVADAEEGLTEALEAEAEAQKAIADARREALYALQDLRIEAERAKIAEASAKLGLIESRRNLQEMIVSGEVAPTDIEFRQAQLAVQSAELDVRSSKNANERTQRELREAERKGIKNSDILTAARERLTDATEAVTDAQEALTDAIKAQSEVFEEQREAIETAQGGIADSTETTQQDIKRAMRIAARNLEEYQENWNTLRERVGTRSTEMLEYIQSLGVGGADELAMLADMNDQEFERMFAKWSDGETKAASLEGQMGDLASFLESMEDTFMFTLDVNTDPATKAAEAFIKKLHDQGLTLKWAETKYGKEATPSTHEGGEPGSGPLRYGKPKPDEIDTRLQKGEFVVRRKQAKKHRGLLKKINAGAIKPSRGEVPQEYHSGGVVGVTDRMRELSGTIKGLSVVGKLDVPKNGLQVAGGALPDLDNIPTTPRGGYTPAMNLLDRWFLRGPGEGLSGGPVPGHTYTEGAGYSQHAYGNARDYFGTADAMMAAFRGLLRAPAEVKNIIYHVIHAAREWVHGMGGATRAYDGTSDMHYGHIHLGAWPPYGGEPPGHPAPYRAGGYVEKDKLAQLHKGEFVVSPEGTANVGIKFLEALNEARSLKLLKQTLPANYEMPDTARADDKDGKDKDGKDKDGKDGKDRPKRTKADVRQSRKLGDRLAKLVEPIVTGVALEKKFQKRARKLDDKRTLQLIESITKKTYDPRFNTQVLDEADLQKMMKAAEQRSGIIRRLQGGYATPLAQTPSLTMSAASTSMEPRERADVTDRQKETIELTLIVDGKTLAKTVEIHNRRAKLTLAGRD